MQTVSIHQAKDRLSALLQAVEAGDEIVITRHGRKIARIVPEAAEPPTDAAMDALRREAIARLRAFHKRMTADPAYNPGDWKRYRDAGRA